MVFPAGFALVAVNEAADMPHSNVRAMLAGAVSDAHKGTGKWASYMDHTGDGASGDCIYHCDGEMKSAPYEIADVGGKSAANIDMSKAEMVTPMTTYQKMAGDDDHYTAMSESFKAANLYTELPIYERFIPKMERDNAGDGSFAGKNKSFPILKPADVSAAVHAMGRAGTDNYGPAMIKANIIKIARAKGWKSELPMAWQADPAPMQAPVAPATEAATVPVVTGLKLVESADWREDTLSLIEASGSPSEMEIKLIKPGLGSSAFYPAEVLKRDGPGVFAKNTQIYINHASRAEEAAHPAGDWHKLAGALSSDAYWSESHAKGPGLYATAKFTSDYAPLIKEKAAFSGMSIRASGEAAMKDGRATTQDGVPVLAKLLSAESVDIVTRAGAGGMVLTESALPASASPAVPALPITENKEDDMSEEEKQELREAARAVREERARRIAVSALSDVSLLDGGKTRVIEQALKNLPKDGVLDETVFVAAVKEAAKLEGAYLASLMGTGVRGMGAPVATPVNMTEEQAKKARKADKRNREALAESRANAVDIFTDLMGGFGNKRAAEITANRLVA